ncbi:TPA: phosphoglycerate kinase [Candidatus Bathyarchaeota archaeon]|nr:phosphoglycerate kinase [Candidatus Bathyarchaeota archaeon]
MKKFLTLDDLDVNGKTVLARVDINCPLERGTKRILDDYRIKASLPTLKELLERGSKLVVLAHQGRPGRWDFVSLKEHAEKFKDLGVDVSFVDEVYGEKASSAIKSLKPGEGVLLENVRFAPEEMEEKTAEEHAKSRLVQALAPLSDAFVNDAFSAAHRSHCSLMGFTCVMPSAAGRLMESEINNLARLLRPEKPSASLLGGAKLSGSIKIIGSLLGRGAFDKVLLTGLIAQAFLKAAGTEIGKINEAFLREETSEKFYKDAKELLRKHPDRVLLPEDFAVEKNGGRKEIRRGELPTEHPICDIGGRTIRKFKEELVKAKTIFVSGPAGVFEKPAFRKGTEELLRAVASSGAFTVAGGGHTIAALRELGLLSRISHASVGGGALETFISSGTMPAIEALKASAREFAPRGNTFKD